MYSAQIASGHVIPDSVGESLVKRVERIAAAMEAQIVIFNALH